MLELYKRVGDYSKIEQTQVKQYAVLGYFDSLAFHRISEFEGLVGLSGDLKKETERDAYRCIKHKLSLFKCECKEACKEICHAATFEDLEQEINNKLVLVATFKFDKSVFDIDFFDSSDQEDTRRNRGIHLICRATTAINKTLKPYKQANQLFWSVYSTLGSSDLVLFLSSENTDFYFQIISELRNIRTKPESNKRMFCFMSSFFTFNDENKKLIETPSSDNWQAQIRCATDAGLSAEQVQDNIAAFLQYTKKQKKQSIYTDCLFGEDELTITLTTSLSDFFKLYVFSDNKSKTLDSDDAPFFHNVNFMRGIHSTHTLIIGPKKNQRPCRSEEPDSDFLSQCRQAFNHVYKLYNENKNYIPKSVYYTIENILYMCSNLLAEEYKLPAGLKIIQILEVFFNSLRVNGDKNRIGESVQKCIRDISFIIPSVLQLDDASINSINEVISVSPFTKLFYAYENFIKTIHNAAYTPNPVVKKPFIFLTVGQTHEYRSNRYFRSSEDYDGRSIVSVNIPNIAYFSLKHSFSSMLHEIGHYIDCNGNRTARNAAFKEAVLNYITDKVVQEGKDVTFNYPETRIDVGKLIGLDDPSQSEVRFDPFVEYTRSSIRDAILYLQNAIPYLEQATQNFAAIANQNDVARTLEKYHHYLYVLKLVHSQIGFLKTLAHAIREARADCIMIKIGRYSFLNYAEIMQYNFSDNKISYDEDHSFHLRFIVIMEYMFRKKYPSENKRGITNLINKHYFYCSDDHKAFLQSFISDRDLYTHITEPIIKYLLSLNLDKLDLTALWDNYTFRAGESDSDGVKPQTLHLEQEIGFHYSHWYEAMQNLFVRGEEHDQLLCSKNGK